MLTILASSQTGMQARHMLERKPPTCMSILSSSTSFCALRRATSGLDSSSATTSSTGRPLMPPDLLMRSTAISTPTSAVLPPAAPAPESGCMVPSLYGLSWPKAARHGAGTNMVAPSTPAPHPTRRRRVTLPLYQNAFDPSESFQLLAIVSSSLDVPFSRLEAFPVPVTPPWRRTVPANYRPTRSKAPSAVRTAWLSPPGADGGWRGAFVVRSVTGRHPRLGILALGRNRGPYCAPDP